MSMRPSTCQVRYLLNLESWDQLFPKFLDQWDPEKKVVVYCSASTCELSHEVAERLRKSGISSGLCVERGVGSVEEQKMIGRLNRPDWPRFVKVVPRIGANCTGWLLRFRGSNQGV